MKQVFQTNTMLRRVVCAVLVAVMVFAMIPLTAPKAAALSKGDKLYFKGDHWLVDGARIAAYFFGNGDEWVSMKDSDNDKMFVCDVPANGYTGVIFCRMNGGTTSNGWNNCWNQTADLTLGSNNYFTVNSGEWDKANGSWDYYECDHSGHTQSGVCTNCESTNVPHVYKNGQCSCGAVDATFKPTYYLVGSINGADYGIEDDYENLGEYKFVDGKLTASFTAKTDVMIKTDTNKWYMTKTYVKENTATFYNCADYPDEAIQKMNIPVGVEVTFTLTENADGTLTLSYTTGECLHPSHDTSGNCTGCGEYVGHTFSDATCTAPKTCSVCGATDGDALGHNYVNGTCSRCGAADPNAATKVVAYLAGSMNSWSTSSTPLAGTDGITGSVTIELAAGTYEFKIYCDGWYGNNGIIEDTTTATSSTGWVMVDNADNCKLKASGGTYTFTFNTNTKTLVVTHNSSGGGDDVKLYVDTTFYDYRSDRELNGTELKNITDQFSQGKDWYIFHYFNKALSDYYSAAAPGASENNPSKLVPIYMGHFQPEWDSDYWYYVNQGKPLFGFKDGKAYRNDGDNHKTKDQMYFMSVNNSIMNVRWEGNEAKPWGGQTYNASWGIVGNRLVENQLMAANSNVALPFFNETFLSQTYGNTGRTYANIYHSVQFPFTKEDPDNNGIEYWVFDSDDTTLEMKQDTSTSQYYLSEVTSNKDAFKNKDHTGADHANGKYGFFPFNSNSKNSNTNTYNYGFGMRLDIPFNLTSDGKLADKYGDKQDIVFKFSGDDDVWVFIDGILVLDIGGSHGAVDGEINFATMTSTVSGVKASGGNIAPADADNNNSNGFQTKFELDKGLAGEHTLTMFYMERGMWESNMKIEFNFIPDSSLWAKETSFTVLKQWNVADASVIPSDVTVQLQRRLQGTTEWTKVENKTLTSANVSTQRVANTWEYNWTNLPNFEGETLYEYRVVELDAQGNVLSNGENNGKTMVAYGDVAGSGATGYTQIISNNQVANPVVVVIDFGLSVDVTVADSATLVGVGNTLKLPVGNSDTVDSNVVQSVEGLHGVATVNGNKIRYTPNDMMMDSADNIGFCLDLGNGQYNYSTLTVIPAANIYYEDSFLHFEDAEGANASFGTWQTATDGTDSNKTQAEDRPGTATDALKNVDADNVYGYDEAYGSFKKYSLGSARYVTVDAATGTPDTAPYASFTFTGTGFDVVSLTDSNCGVIMVEVKQNGTTKVNYIVNNYYGMVFNESTGIWENAGNDSDCLYQVPVIKVEGLTYGTYDVTIKAAYLEAMDKTEATGYTIWMDAIRIYNPALNDKTSNDAYESDGESNPHLTTLKKLLIVPGFDAYDDSNADEKIHGVVFVEGKSDVVSMAEYANQGPNNETYLKNDNSVVFKFRVKDRDDIDSQKGPQINLQIGAKLAIGNAATLKVAVNNSTTATKVTEVNTATNMFYKLPAVGWEKVDGYWESDPIMFLCEADEGDILSLTDLKLTGPDAGSVSYAAVDTSEGTKTNEANILTFVDSECYTYAVKVMSASDAPTEPDATEPETTEPEVTEPEVTEPEVTEPEVTEPEVTEPETTEPEVTEPEVTEPETTEPEVTEPEVTEPETTIPASTAPAKDPDNAQTGDAYGQIQPVFAAAAFLSILAVLCMAAFAARRAGRD